MPKETEPTEHKIDVDFPGLIRLLGDFLYKDRSAVVRELLSNSNDALIARKRELGFADAKPEIRIWLDPEAGRLLIKDNGVGMSREDLIEYLATVCAGLTRTRAHDDPQYIDLTIGKFGVGFLSSFIVADKIVVTTKRVDCPGYRWEAEANKPERISRDSKQVGGSQLYKITQINVPDVGTTVQLDLVTLYRHTWNEDAIKKIVLRNARHFIFPIYWGEDGSLALNDLQAPWYSDRLPSESDHEGYRAFLANYGDHFSSAVNAMEIIPLHREDIRGVLYVPPASAFKFEPVGSLDIYCRRVFVTQDYHGLIPEEFAFVRGIVDCYRFRLSASREDIQRDNFEYTSVAEFIGIRILDHFADLAKRALIPQTGPEPDEGVELAGMRIRGFLDKFHLAMKNALTITDSHGHHSCDDRYLRELERFMPFQSSASIGVTSIPDYLDRQSKVGRQPELLYVRTQDEYTALRPIADKKHSEFLWLQHEVDMRYLERYAALINVPCASATERLEGLPVVHPEGGWKQIVRYYQEQLNHPEFSLSAYLSEFEPESVAGQLLVARESEGQRQLEGLVREMEKDSVVTKNDPLYRELDRMRQKRPHNLYVNGNHPVLKRLASLLGQGSLIPLEPILHPMFHDIIAATGHVVPESHLAEYQTKVYDSALDSFMQQTQVVALGNQLEIERHQVGQLQEQARTLREELDKVRITKHQEATDEVFFIRPFEDGFLDWASQQIKEICTRRDLKFIDPKNVLKSGNILNQVVDYLRRSKFVIAEITDTKNANVYYEAGFVEGNFPNKLILIAKQSVIDGKELPFDFLTQRILGYTTDAPGFAQFVKRLDNAIEEVLGGLGD